MRLLYQREFREAGMTIAEMITVMLIVGILVAIMAPGWRAFHLNQVLAMAQDEAFQSIRQTQAAAIQSHQVWQVSFQNTASAVQWATYPADFTTALTWQTLLSGVQIDPALTTLNQQGAVYRVQFSRQGEVNGQLGKLTIKAMGERSLQALCGCFNAARGAAKSSRSRLRISAAIVSGLDLCQD